MNHDELMKDFNDHEKQFDELELSRLVTCYKFASGDDRKVIWAVLNKYVPLLSAEGLI